MFFVTELSEAHHRHWELQSSHLTSGTYKAFRSIRARPRHLPAWSRGRAKHFKGLSSSHTLDMDYSRKLHLTWLASLCCPAAQVPASALMNPTVGKALITSLPAVCGICQWFVSIRDVLGWSYPFWGSDCQNMEKSLNCPPVHHASGFLGQDRYLQIQASQQTLVFGIGHGFFPAKKQEQRPSPWKQSQNSTLTPSTLQFLACSRVIYAKQRGMEFICLDTERYNCRSYQKDAVYVSKLLTWCEAIVWNLISCYMHLRARLRSEGGHQWIFQHCVVLFHVERIQFVWSTVWTKMK